MADDIRTFIAFELPSMVRQQVVNATQRLSFLGDRVRWSKADDAHLTLKFLGDVSSEQLPEIVSAFQGVSQKTPPLTLRVVGVGGFPDLDQARVIWLGVQGDLAGLRDLHSHLEAALTPLGFEPERRKFFPHITLGRSRRNPVAVDVSRVGTFSPVHFRVDRLTLMKSELRPEGAVYSPLFYGALKK